MQFVFLIFLFLSAFTSAPVRAEDYYVELGRATSEEQAKTMWLALQEKHKVLDDYDVFPTKILQPDGAATYRVQAGPMLDKGEAQRVCNRLFRRKVPCFVIEGFDPKGASNFSVQEPVKAPEPAIVSQQDFTLPWQDTSPPPPLFVESPAPAPSAPKEQPKAEVEFKPLSPALMQPEVREEPKPLENLEKGKAKVDVAEAIPVPVSQATEVTVVGAPPEVSSADLSAETPPPAPVAVPGWLSVQPFLDESRAQRFWKELKKITPERTAKLSMQIVHPVVSHDLPKVILSMGSFESEDAAMKFCRDYVPTSGYLQCEFASQPPQDAGAEPWKPKATFRAPEEEISLYWAEVLSEATQETALEKWEGIRTDNDDILSNVRSQITTSLNMPGNYVVRIGPMKNKKKATQLCEALQKRSVECRLISL